MQKVHGNKVVRGPEWVLYADSYHRHEFQTPLSSTNAEPDQGKIRRPLTWLSSMFPWFLYLLGAVSVFMFVTAIALITLRGTTFFTVSDSVVIGLISAAAYLSKVSPRKS